ncbi:MAG: hypothetical protein WCH78_13770 [Bacteroidota bacterium]
MKKLLFIFLIVFILIACNNASKESGSKENASQSSSVVLPFPISYSSDFEIGDKKFAQYILEISKDYDNNTIQNSVGKFADSVEFHMPDGTILNGPRDSVLAAVIGARNSLASATDYFYSIVVLKPKGKDETWVSFWEKEVDVTKDGKKDATFLNDLWKFNKDGKISAIYQFAAK